ncbi:NPCBM/NEW2 domain-containing protein [Fibrobacterales bacterium]|nr:NPCBM/NEW2 domain-containing protein [Fibrobacterales bacterium]
MKQLPKLNTNLKSTGLPILATFALLGIAAFFFKSTENNIAKAFDLDWGLHLSLFNLAWIIPGIIWSWKDLREAHAEPGAKSSKGFIIALLAVVIAFCAFAVTQVNLQHRVLSDESSWESMGIQMFYNQDAAVCNMGHWVDEKLICEDRVSNFKGKSTGIVYFLSAFFVEPSRDSALAANLPIAAFAILFLGLAVRRIFQSSVAGLVAAMFLAALPTYIFQARSASTETLHTLMFAMILYFGSLLIPRFKARHLMLLFPLLGFMSGTRLETLFGYGAIAVFLLPWSLEKPWRLPSVVAGFLWFCLPAVVTIAGYKGYNFQGGTYDAHSMENLYINFWTNIQSMMNLEAAYGDQLKYPFFAFQTILLLVASLHVLVQAVITKKYRWWALSGVLFFIQPIVIMINVSGNFTIDINQRYVIVAMPLFAVAVGLMFKDIFEKLDFKQRFTPYIIGFFAVLMVGNIYVYKDIFPENIMFKRNKLLAEEEYLDKWMKNKPDSAIYIYARPWQMICSRRNTYSEARLLGWNNETFADKLRQSGGHLYLVRGQDGWGKLNKGGRVVGFKTTDKVEQVLKRFKNTQVERTAKPFGYPLTIYKLEGFAEASPLAGLSFSPTQNKISMGDTSEFKYFIPVNDTIQITLKRNEEVLLSEQLGTKQGFIKLAPEKLKDGINHITATFAIKDSIHATQYEQVYVNSDKVSLLTTQRRTHASQSWGSAQVDKTVEGAQLKNNSIPHNFGLGVHANSLLTYQLNNHFDTLHITAGPDDESMCGDGAKYLVKGDGKTLWVSRDIYAQEKQDAKIVISGIRNLTLETDSLSNNFCDHTSWYAPWLEKAN